MVFTSSHSTNAGAFSRIGAPSDALAKGLSADAVALAFQRFEKSERLPLVVLAENIQCKGFTLFDDRVSAESALTPTTTSGG
jgi:hypothetical protein